MSLSDADGGTPQGRGSSAQSSLRKSRLLSAPVSIEDERDLMQFLKVVRHEWSCPKNGQSDIQRIMRKLKAIGVHDTAELIQRVADNTINEDLFKEGYARFSRKTLDSIRKNSSFIRALDHLTEANYRQSGLFAPVPQMLARKNLRQQASQNGTSSMRSLGATHSQRPASEGCNRRRANTSSSTFGEKRSSPDAGMLWRRPSSAGTLGAFGRGASTFDPGASATSATDDLTGLGCLMFGDDLAPEDRPPVAALHLRDAKPRRTHSRGGDRSHQRLSYPPMLESASARTLGSPMGSERQRLVLGDTGSATSCSSSPARRRCSGEMVATPAAASGVGSGGGTFMATDTGDLCQDAQQLDHRLRKEAVRMQVERRQARWTTLDSGTLLQHGDAVLREQACLDDRQALLRLMKSEGLVSPLRKHVAKNIASRLREEEERGVRTEDLLDTNQRCINIRKDLLGMLNARRELGMLRRAAFDSNDDAYPERPTGLSLEVFRKSKGKSHESPSGRAGQSPSAASGKLRKSIVGPGSKSSPTLVRRRAG